MWGRSQPTVRRRRWRPPLARRASAGPSATAAHRLPLGAERAPHPLGPAVTRRRPLELSSRCFPRPRVLERLFGAAGAHPDAVARICSLFAAPSLGEAASIAEGLLHAGGDAEADRVLAGLCDAALGERPLPGPWGHDPVVDALRLRVLCDPVDGPPPRTVRWSRFLAWAGRQLQTAPLGKLPAALAAPAVASLAAAQGYRATLQLLTARAAARPPGGFAEPLSRVALRCALEGVFLPQLVAFLVPGPRRRAAHERHPWAAALLAQRAYREQGSVAGLVHTAAALLAADLRERLATFLPREAGALLRRRWWSSLPAEAEEHTPAAVALVRGRGDELVRLPYGPGPQGWGGPDFLAVLGALQRLLRGGSPSFVLELLLDDRLAVAALYALVGYAPSARAQLAEAAVPTPLAHARDALAAALRRGSAATGEPADALAERPWAPAADRVYQRLRETPDPSVELASPHWLLGEARGALMSRLVAEGRFDAARALRSMLDRPDLRRDLEPFWLLRGGPEDTAALVGLAAWLAARRDPPEAAEHRRFAEDLCRRLAVEGASA